MSSRANDWLCFIHAYAFVCRRTCSYVFIVPSSSSYVGPGCGRNGTYPYILICINHDGYICTGAAAMSALAAGETAIAGPDGHAH